MIVFYLFKNCSFCIFFSLHLFLAYIILLALIFLFPPCFYRQKPYTNPMWLLFAFLSAVFAALTSILAKIGIQGVNSNLGTAIRTFVVLLLAWGLVYLTGAQKGIADITRKSWVFLILSGLATGGSWLFYFKALQSGDVSKVVAIDKFSLILTIIMAFFLLGEPLTPKVIAGGILITLGTLIMVFWVQFIV